MTVLVAVVIGLLSYADQEAESASFSTQDSQNVQALAELATVRVRGQTCAGGLVGSGFVVNESLLTNRHLLEASEFLTVDRNLAPQLLPVSFRSAQADVAVAQYVGSGVQLSLAAENPPVGTPILIAGYPGGSRMNFVESSVHIYGDGRTWGVSGDVMLIDTRTTGGFSGGPVLDRQGDVVAMLQGVDDATGLTLAIPVSELRSVLEVSDSYAGLPITDCSEDQR